jgi:hypothetical protein
LLVFESNECRSVRCDQIVLKKITKIMTQITTLPGILVTKLQITKYLEK